MLISNPLVISFSKVSVDPWRAGPSHCALSRTDVSATLCHHTQCQATWPTQRRTGSRQCDSLRFSLGLKKLALHSRDLRQHSKTLLACSAALGPEQRRAHEEAAHLQPQLHIERFGTRDQTKPLVSAASQSQTWHFISMRSNCNRESPGKQESSKPTASFAPRSFGS